MDGVVISKINTPEQVTPQYGTPYGIMDMGVDVTLPGCRIREIFYEDYYRIYNNDSYHFIMKS